MTDDERLAELFRHAAADPGAPAPGFDHGDVVAASRRITARRRTAVLAGAVALFAVVGVGAAVALPGAGQTVSTAAAPDAAPLDAEAPAAAAPEAAAPGAAAQRGGADSAGGRAEGPAAAPVPGGVVAGVPFGGAPLGPGTGECADRQDPALRSFLEEVLPEVTGATEAVTTQECRPGAERYLALEVRDGAVPGLFSLSYLPPGTILDMDTTGAVSVPTASGGTLVVRSRAESGATPGPFEDRLDAVAAYLAPRL